MIQTLSNEYFTTLEAAQKLGTSRKRVASLCARGKWNAEKFGAEYAIPRANLEPKAWREQKPDDLARYFRTRLRIYIGRHGLKLRILGILATGDKASQVYAQYLIYACKEVGITLDLRVLSPRVVRRTIEKANADTNVHGIFVFYPIQGEPHDSHLKSLVSPHKDIEGLSPFWMNRLYKNIRFVDAKKTKQAILPCTPLAILKMLDFVGLAPDVSPVKSFKGVRVAVFNRSYLVGKPLAYMLANDGAEVYSFDIDGGIRFGGHAPGSSIRREEALHAADLVVTGVPSREFVKIRGEEIKEGAICLNFSYYQNFEDSAKVKAGVYVPRVGPMTIAMCLRNMVRLYENYKNRYAG